MPHPTQLARHGLRLREHKTASADWPTCKPSGSKRRSDVSLSQPLRRSIRRLKTSHRKPLVASSLDGNVRGDHPASGRGVLVPELTLDIGNIGDEPEKPPHHQAPQRAAAAAANHVHCTREWVKVQGRLEYGPTPQQRPMSLGRPQTNQPSPGSASFKQPSSTNLVLRLSLAPLNKLEQGCGSRPDRTRASRPRFIPTQPWTPALRLGIVTFPTTAHASVRHDNMVSASRLGMAQIDSRRTASHRRTSRLALPLGCGVLLHMMPRVVWSLAFPTDPEVLLDGHRLRRSALAYISETILILADG